LSLQPSADYLSLLGVTNFVQIPSVSKNTPGALFSPDRLPVRKSQSQACAVL